MGGSKYIYLLPRGLSSTGSEPSKVQKLVDRGRSWITRHREIQLLALISAIPSHFGIENGIVYTRSMKYIYFIERVKTAAVYTGPAAAAKRHVPDFQVRSGWGYCGASHLLASPPARRPYRRVRKDPTKGTGSLF